MAIVATEVVSDNPGNPRLVMYRCQDSNGEWHSYGPVFTTDPSFDADDFKQAVADKVALSLVLGELEQALQQ